MVALWAEILQAEVDTDRRGTPRRIVNLMALAAFPKEVLILDLSMNGMMLETKADLTVGEVIEIELPEVGMTAAEVTWRRDAYFGCVFLSPVPAAAINAAFLRSAPKQTDAPSRRKKSNVDP